MENLMGGIVKLKNITRLEVIDSQTGRKYTGNSLETVEYSLQDDGRTLKLFVATKPINYSEMLDALSIIHKKSVYNHEK